MMPKKDVTQKGNFIFVGGAIEGMQGCMFHSDLRQAMCKGMKTILQRKVG